MKLSAHGLIKRYGAAPEHEAVRNASVDVQAGEFVSIVGRSGSGKSTFLAMLGALTRPTAGKLLIDNTDVWALTEAERAAFRCRQVGFVFQFPSLLPNLTAVDNVVVPALFGRTMKAEDAYARAHDLLAQVGLGERVNADPATMSSGEQRRVVIARALINSPHLLLADEPTSDLDEDSEADIMDLLEALRSSKGFSFVLVTHNLELANRAQCTYEMRQGVLTAAALPRTSVEAARHPRHFGPRNVRIPAEASPLSRSVPLGANLWRVAATFLLGGAVVITGILLLDFGVGKYQQMLVREHTERIARLSDMALSGLQSDIQSIADLGDGHYQLTVYLVNASGGEPTFVMLQDMRAYVQVGSVWQEVPLRRVDDGIDSVLRIDGRHVYQFLFDAQARNFTELLPNYMHVRFSDVMLVSPSSTPIDDVFERRDNYYAYLKPSNVADDIILKKMKFSGKPPVWIPMPPH